MGVIKFNGVLSSDLNVQIEHFPNYDAPEKDYDVVHIPGRNGDLIVDNGSYKNIDRHYEIFVDGTKKNDLTTSVASVLKWLHSASGYARLEDSYEPDFFRHACYSTNISLENMFCQVGRGTITFNCKPQRFLKSGEMPITYSANNLIINKTGFNALPIIVVHGSGSGKIQVGDYSVSISDISTYTVIDSELQDAYKGTENRNSYITTNEFPVLVPGVSEISFSGGITSIDLIPNWWTL